KSRSAIAPAGASARGSSLTGGMAGTTLASCQARPPEASPRGDFASAHVADLHLLVNVSPVAVASEERGVQRPQGRGALAAELGPLFLICGGNESQCPTRVAIAGGSPDPMGHRLGGLR